MLAELREVMRERDEAIEANRSCGRNRAGRQADGQRLVEPRHGVPLVRSSQSAAKRRDAALGSNAGRGVKVCGTPGCSLRDWHHGPCEPLRDLCGQRSRAPSRKARCAFVQLDGEEDEPQAGSREKPRAGSREKRRRPSSGGRSGEAEAATPHEGEEGPAGEEPLWVQCDRCAKWRLLLRGETVEEGGAAWFCAMNADERANSCDAPQV